MEAKQRPEKIEYRGCDCLPEVCNCYDSIELETPPSMPLMSGWGVMGVGRSYIKSYMIMVSEYITINMRKV